MPCFYLQVGSSLFWNQYLACCIARLLSLCGIQSIGSSPSFGINIYLVLKLGFCPCVALQHWIFPIIWDKYISCFIVRLVSLCDIQSIGSSPSFGINIYLVLQLGLCPCVAFRALDYPHHLGLIYSLFYSQACVLVCHLEQWIVPIIWDQYRQLIDGQTCVPVWHLENCISSWILIARLVSLCGIQSLGFSPGGVDSGWIVPGQIRSRTFYGVGAYYFSL